MYGGVSFGYEDEIELLLCYCAYTYYSGKKSKQNWKEFLGCPSISNNQQRFPSIVPLVTKSTVTIAEARPNRGYTYTRVYEHNLVKLLLLY